MNEYIAGSELNKKYGVSVSTLRSLANAGKISVRRIGENNKRYYSEQDVRNYLNVPEVLPPISIPERKNVVIYARVSSSNQRQDLDRQVQLLSDYIREDKQIIREIGSGLNYKRRGFLLLLERIVNKRDISRIVILYRDRIMRFGYELFEWICNQHGVEIQVISDMFNEKSERSEEIEMAEDILSIINYFTAKRNGLKASKNKKIRIKVEEDPYLSDNESEVSIE